MVKMKMMMVMKLVLIMMVVIVVIMVGGEDIGDDGCLILDSFFFRKPSIPTPEITSFNYYIF